MKFKTFYLTEGEKGPSFPLVENKATIEQIDEAVQLRLEMINLLAGEQCEIVNVQLSTHSGKFPNQYIVSFTYITFDTP